MMEDFESMLKASYLAGFFDADGTIGIYADQLTIKVTQKYPLVLNKFQTMFGGTVYHHPAGHYHWYAHGQTAYSALNNMHAFLIAKREQAELAMRFQESVGKKGLRVTEETRAIRDTLAFRISMLKKNPPRETSSV